MKQCVFLASIEGDLLIHAGISSLIKEIFPEQKTILILPRYSRVYRRADDYRQFFDNVIEIEGINFTLNLKGIVHNIIAIQRIVRSISQFHNCTFFLFDVYNLVELTVYSFIKHHKESQLVTVTAFEGDEINFNNLEIVVKGTLTKSIYSLALIGKLFYEYRVKNSENAGLNYFKGECDLQLSINKSKYRNTHKQIVSELPYPALFLTDKVNNLFDQYKILKPFSVIVFVESQIAHWTENYWEKTNQLIEMLEHRGVTIYVKDHPNCAQSDVDRLTSKNINVLSNEISAEMLFINNAHNIVGVFGHGSTSLITASWLMISAYDTSKYFAFNANILNKFSAFLTLGNDIKTITNRTELNALEFIERNGDDSSLVLNKKIWENALSSRIYKS